MRMRISRTIIFWVLATLFFEGKSESISEDCLKAQKEHESCISKAYENYANAFKAGHDRTKPDWMSRIVCNYLTEVIEICSVLLVTCHTPEELDQKKYLQLKAAIHQVTGLVKNWNSAKCPTVKTYYLEHQLPEEGQHLETAYGEGSDTRSKTRDDGCRNENGLEGREGDISHDGCIQYTCKNNVWRPSLDPIICCYQGKPYSPQDMIPNELSDDGCGVAHHQCVLQDGQAVLLLSVENKCLPATQERARELKSLVGEFKREKC